jgi:MarR family transcriptional regulator, lower aerobic nicotinate degradation pathway regulator
MAATDAAPAPATSIASASAVAAPADRTPARLTTKPSWLLSQAATHGHRLLTDGLAPAASRGYHYRLLAALEEFGPASQARLGGRAGVDRSDVVAALNDLSARGMVERTPDPADRRRNIVTITPAGRAHLRRLDQLLDKVQDELLAPLSSAERAQLVRLLTRILEHHGAVR